MNEVYALPTTMRAVVLADSTLEVMDIAVPRPRAGEALVRVEACGVCHTDLHVMKREVEFPRPAVLGHEVSGTIVAIGDGTTDERGLAVGCRIAGAFIMPCTSCDACRRGRDDLCAQFFGSNRLNGTLYDGESRLAMPDGGFLAMYSMGALAEYCVVPLSALAVVPDTFDLASACVLGCAGLTAYGAVFRAGQIEPGSSMAVVGAGGIGGGVIQMARAAGASTVIAVDVAADKLDQARALGATHVVDALHVDAVAAVRQLTGGVDVAFEALGRPATFSQAVRMLADGGRMVAIGIAAGAAAADIEITPLVRRGHSIVGSFGGRTRQDLPEVIRLAEAGQFDVTGLITRRYPLEQAPDAYRDLAAGQIVGRAIISVA